MGKIRIFRIWYYLRTGYQLYFSFVFAAINTMVITYFLAIERAPILIEVFPTFGHYATVLIIIGLPILVFTGFIHFKKIPAFKSDQEVSIESNPYVYKLPPGYWLHVVMPFYLLSTKYLTKLAKNEKITEDELKEMSDLQEKMGILLKGRYIGTKGKKLSFGQDEKI